MELPLTQRKESKVMPGRALSLIPSINTLLDYARSQEWKGWDPFDGLNSRLFNKTPLRHSALARLMLVQAMKRSPINLRPLLLIPYQENSKSLALFLSSAIRLEATGILKNQLSGLLLKKLLQLRSHTFEELCWGYPFDWQNRHFMLPKNHPNMICSVFGGNALLDYMELYPDTALLPEVKSIGSFILKHLNRTTEDQGFCFSYTPLDHGQVHNANLLGAAFLARVWMHTHDQNLKDAALSAAAYTVSRQKNDGAWYYGESPRQKWIDSFHTGYNLTALKTLHLAYKPPWILSSLEKGYEFYRSHFFEPGGVVKYFDHQTYPLDIHAIAHAIYALPQLTDLDPSAMDLAFDICDWAHGNMRSNRGYFYYQSHRHWTNKIPYMRWNQAWMLLGMSQLFLSNQKREGVEYPYNL